jgi:anti-sigma28 factor (negative regulator of flagellin synthesis)
VSGSATKETAAFSSTRTLDGLQLSRFAGTLSRVMRSESASRSEKVAQLAAAVKSGTYRVDAAAAGHAIVSHAISVGQNAQ